MKRRSSMGKQHNLLVDQRSDTCQKRTRMCSTA